MASAGITCFGGFGFGVFLVAGGGERGGGVGFRVLGFRV